MAYAGTRGLLTYTSRKSMAVPAPSGISVGDVILILAEIASTSKTLSGPGTTLVPTTTIGGSLRAAVFAVVHDGSSTYAVTWGNTSLNCCAVSIAFTGRGSTILCPGSFSTGSGTSATAAAISPESSGYDLALLAGELGGTSAEPPAGMTERLDGEATGFHVATQDGIEAGSTGAKAFKLATSQSWYAVLVGVAPPPEASSSKLVMIL